MNILVDIDGVLADLAGYTCAIVGYQGEITTWRMFDLLTPGQASQARYLWRDKRGFWETLPLIDGAKEGVEKLQQQFDVYFCSTPYLHNPLCAKEKLHWVELHFGKDMVKRTILTHDKTLIQAGALIDDKPYIEGAIKPSWKHIIFDQPYNQNKNGLRLLSWQHLNELLPQIKQDYGFPKVDWP